MRRSRPRVLMSVRAPRPTTNPYVVQLAGALAEHVDVVWFSWRTAILGRYDVLHWHWPEVALRRAGAPARAAARLRFAAVLARVAWTSTPVVRTLHNRAPHEALGRLDAALVRGCEAQTTWWVVLNEQTVVPHPERATLAPLAVDPEQAFGGGRGAAPTGAPTAGRVLYFGLVRRYKGVEELVGAFAGVDAPGATLRVVGSCEDPALATAVTGAASADARVSLTLAHVEDAVLAAEVAAAQLVVLPHRAMHNSGSALTALALGRPVLVPSTPTTEALAREVGEGWVLRYRGDLAPGDLVAAMSAADRALRGAAPPDLAARRWPAVAAAHARAYASALSVAPLRPLRAPR